MNDHLNEYLNEQLNPGVRPEGPRRALIGAFALAVAHHILFYGHAPGVSVLLFVSLFYGYMLFYAKDRIRRDSRMAWFFPVIILLLSATYLLFGNPVFEALNLLAIPTLIFLHLAYLLNPGKRDWSQLRMIADGLGHLLPQNVRHWPKAFGLLKAEALRGLGDRRKSVLVKVLVGLGFALPILFIVVNLLASADGVFNLLLSKIPRLLSDIPLGEGIVRCLWVLFFTLAFFGYLWSFVEPKIPDWPQPPEEEGAPSSARFQIDPIVTATLLISVNAVYVLFVAIQFSYLFGAWEGLLPTGKTYAEYARSGFFELVAVSAVNFAILTVVLVLEGHGRSLLRNLNRVLLYVLVSCTGVILISAYTRLALYEEAYGYTYIRFLVHAFMIVLAVFLLVAAFRIRYRRIPLGKCFIVIGLCAYVLVNYAGMDRIIAAKNIERYRASGKIDAPYLAGLSTDAVPLLVRFGKEEYPALKNDLAQYHQDLTQTHRAWPSFNWSRYRAEKVLADAGR